MGRTATDRCSLLRGFSTRVLVSAPLLVGCGGAEGTNTTSSSPGTGGRVVTHEPEEMGETHEGPCSLEGTLLVDAVNELRADSGLEVIPVSPSLCEVSQTHVIDLVQNRPYEESEQCALQSWSDKTAASGCCYAVDQSNPECMWDKPGELTEYPGLGYESVAVNNQDPQEAIDHFFSVDAHVDLFLERNSWSNLSWRAIGAAYAEGHAVIWFGAEDDPALE